jgi:hypothetical protein
LWGPHNAHTAQFADLIRAGLDAEDAGNLDDALNQFSEAIKIAWQFSPVLGQTGKWLKKAIPNLYQGPDTSRQA